MLQDLTQETDISWNYPVTTLSLPQILICDHFVGTIEGVKLPRKHQYILL